MWDVFISHAWENKEDVAGPLAEALRRKGLHVWYDEFTLTLGGSLRRSIDLGLAQSRYGVVILSPHFFAKEQKRGLHILPFSVHKLYRTPRRLQSLWRYDQNG